MPRTGSTPGGADTELHGRRAGVAMIFRLVVLAAVISAGCGRIGTGGGADPAAERAGGVGYPGRPNVILFSLDTLRADHVARAPRLRKMAREGRWFTGARASASWTLPSHVSLFTSLPYFEHQVPLPGARVNFEGQGIAPQQPTLAAALSRAGHYTAASTEGGYVSDVYGLGLGFDEYLEIDDASGRAEARIAAHLDHVRGAVARSRGRPLFLFVHTYLAHDYFTNSPDYHAGLEPFGPELVRHGAFIDDLRRGRRAVDHTLPTEYLASLYARGVELADRLLASVVDELLAATGNAPLLVVATSDHGESIGDRSRDGRATWWHHGTGLPPSQLRVPLILWTNTSEASGEIFSSPVSTIDVAPSLLARLGVGIPESFRGRDDLFGDAPPVGDRPVATPVLSGNNILHPTDPWQSGIEHSLVEDGLEYSRFDRVTGEPLDESCARVGASGRPGGSPAASFEAAAEPLVALREEVSEEVPVAECAPIRSLLARFIGERAGAALVVRADGAVTIELEPDDPLRGIFAVQSTFPSPGPVLDAEAGTIRWESSAPDDALLLFPRTTSLRLHRILRGDAVVAEGVEPFLEQPVAATLRTRPGGGWLSLTVRGIPEPRSQPGAAVPASLLERLRALGYLR